MLITIIYFSEDRTIAAARDPSMPMYIQKVIFQILY